MVRKNYLCGKREWREQCCVNHVILMLSATINSQTQNDYDDKVDLSSHVTIATTTTTTDLQEISRAENRYFSHKSSSITFWFYQKGPLLGIGFITRGKCL